jgi:hypothetical protein
MYDVLLFNHAIVTFWGTLEGCRVLLATVKELLGDYLICQNFADLNFFFRPR